MRKDAKDKISKSLSGKFGPLSRRWKGENASYVAKHMWIIKHYGNAMYCENNKTHNAKRFEWANISGKYLRNREDYKMLCPSCHRKQDHGNFCRNGHEYTPENTYIRKEGWRVCKTCRKETIKRYEKRNKIQGMGFRV